MGDLTRLQLRDELTVTLDNREDTIASVTRKNLWLLWSYRYVSMPTIYRHWQLHGTTTIALVAGTGTYSVPADLWAVHHFANTTRGRKLYPRDIRQIDDELVRNGEPTLYALWGTTGTPPIRRVEIRDRPSSSYAADTMTLRYWQRPADFSGDGATTVIAPEFDQVIVKGAEWKGWSALGRLERAETARREFGAMIGDVSDPMQVEGEDTGHAVEVVVYDAMPV